MTGRCPIESSSSSRLVFTFSYIQPMADGVGVVAGRFAARVVLVLSGRSSGPLGMWSHVSRSHTAQEWLSQPVLLQGRRTRTHISVITRLNAFRYTFMPHVRRSQSVLRTGTSTHAMRSSPAICSKRLPDTPKPSTPATDLNSVRWATLASDFKFESWLAGPLAYTGLHE